MKYTYQVEVVFATKKRFSEHVMTAPIWETFDEAEHYAKRLVNEIPSVEEFRILRLDADIFPWNYMWIEGDPVCVVTRKEEGK